MTDLIVRELSEVAFEALKKRAAENNRSVEEEALEIVTEAVAEG